VATPGPAVQSQNQRRESGRRPRETDPVCEFEAIAGGVCCLIPSAFPQFDRAWISQSYCLWVHLPYQRASTGKPGEGISPCPSGLCPDLRFNYQNARCLRLAGLSRSFYVGFHVLHGGVVAKDLATKWVACDELLFLPGTPHDQDASTPPAIGSPRTITREMLLLDRHGITRTRYHP
jgi:hypothetical protein